MSNTKLGKSQKAYRKQLMRQLREETAGFDFGYTRNVVVLRWLNRDNDKTTRIVTAIASPDEEKCRYKVGEYLCLCRWADGLGVLMPRNISAQYMADYMADFS